MPLNQSVDAKLLQVPRWVGSPSCPAGARSCDGAHFAESQGRYRQWTPAEEGALTFGADFDPGLDESAKSSGQLILPTKIIVVDRYFSIYLYVDFPVPGINFDLRRGTR